MNKPKIQIILGSTRDGRRGELIAKWVFAESQKSERFEAELIDLRDWPLPFYNEAMGPAGLRGNYHEPLGKKWAEKIAEADGYIIVTPEYNHSYPAVLKNAVDYAYLEWSRKPVAFVSYSISTTAGARAVEQLRLVMVEFNTAVLAAALHIPSVPFQFTDIQQIVSEQLQKKLDSLFGELAWWARALKSAREDKTSD